MTDLVVCVSGEQRKLNHVKRVIEAEGWRKVFLVGSEKADVDGEHIAVDEKNTISEISHLLESSLKGRIEGIEVGVNVVCGSGKLHMALMSALLKLGLAVRFIALTREGVREI